MEQQGAPDQERENAPIFEGFRRGYDPEQVDRFVADQQRRLDETLTRATEAERRLAAAIGQLRELHRRVATLESEGHAAQAQSQPLDTLGERVQRILQEAWEGAHAIRQSAEQEAAEIRLRTVEEATEVVASARRKAKVIEEEIERRRSAYLGRVEEERSRAVAQITQLHEQRQSLVGELVRMKDSIESTVGKVSGLRAVGEGDPKSSTARHPAPTMVGQTPAMNTAAPAATNQARPSRPRTVRDVAPRTMPVVHLGMNDPAVVTDTSELVRSHRAAVESQGTQTATIRTLRRDERQGHSPSVFDFEKEQPS